MGGPGTPSLHAAMSEAVTCTLQALKALYRSDGMGGAFSYVIIVLIPQELTMCQQAFLVESLV